MTSILVSEVHRLPYAHQHLHDSRTPHIPHHPYRSAPAGPVRTDVLQRGHHSQAASSMDTPMTDAASHSQSSSSSRTLYEQSTSSSQSLYDPPQSQLRSGLAPPSRRDSISAQYSGSEPPPSPRFRPQSQATPRASDKSSDRVVPSSEPAQRIPTPTSPNKIKVKSLSHIQSFVLDDESPLSPTGSRLRRDVTDVAPQYEISEMPVTDIIEMVAGLLTKITTTNDKQQQHLHRQIPPPEGAHNMNAQTTSVLAFHGKNVPSISILSYLSRIHKYCPTTYEVFLSLLVYFDRMTERVNAGPMQHLRQNSQHHSADSETKEYDGSRHSSISVSALNRDSPDSTHNAPSASAANTPPPSGSLGRAPEPTTSAQHSSPPSPPIVAEPEEEPYNFSHFFVVDSFNIHRLVIAGVTCASKFFSDIFYTNSRYAKVGGLPLPELNHLELQFLLLNDFRLAVPLEEMEAYGTMLVEFYAREVLAGQPNLGDPTS